MDETMRKEKLLAELEGSRAEWDSLLDEMGAEKLTIPGVVGDWSVKDVAAHLTFWERRPVKWFEAAVRGGKPEPTPMPRDLSEDEENAWIYAQSRDVLPAEVLAESRAVHDALVEAAKEMGEEELTRPREWLNNTSLVDALAGNSYEHYREHAQAVRAWWERQRQEEPFS